MTVEDELGELLQAVGLGARQRRAVARRLGWDGGAPATLAGAATTEGYTRERVRQLEGRVQVTSRSVV
jgi:DNA-directed RNA polymerase sigma subunit (sigma70/sigma32)